MVTAQLLVDKRRHCIVAAFVASALLAPPEVLSQLMLVIPLLALYEAAIAFFRWIESSR
jgi:sec-independent protein translocase protein TatC